MDKYTKSIDKRGRYGIMWNRKNIELWKYSNSGGT